MAHRIFRLSISPERAPEVRRVVDFDGAATLHDVHLTIQETLELDNDHLYAFYLSNEYFDRATEYGIADDSAHDSSQSKLFRLALREGQAFGYLFDFGDELRHTVTVVSISDAEAPLQEPAVVESVGDPPPQYDDESEGPLELPEHLTDVAPRAEAVLDLSERLELLYEEDDAKLAQDLEAGKEPGEAPEAIVALLRELSQAALELAAALEEDDEALYELDEYFAERDLLPSIAGLPLALVAVRDLDRALAVARAFTFASAESFNGDIAIILAESGKRGEAIAQLEANVAQFPESYVAALKAGEAYEALKDAVAAEASYRRAITLAEDEDDHEEAINQLAGFLEDAGRADEIDKLFENHAWGEGGAVRGMPSLPRVGRNDPCPCGSGQKYKKCHGV